ncbi:P-loop containing nucleoside triphosphate hydrolase protein [Sordaria brevicollis]|uniref:Thymidylate kinase n=1 Tax=Sordaria brevicollis TaxID=83679 RepID=A0AAE0PMB5_SORBR|nr:P-loop containing nucleoside triphosphate hydrolase protein [Sordaria brevicollis]
MASTSETNTPIARGALIVIEGLDRSGKTTQVTLLKDRFLSEGRKNVKAMRFPDRTTPIGQMIDSYLKSQSQMDDHVIHLLFSANRWEAVKTITEELAKGTTLILDRYYYSGIVYSAAKQNPSLSLSWARAPEIGLPRPDLVLFLDLDEEQARLRGGWGDELYEKAEMQRRVRELFWGLSMGRVGTVTVPSGGVGALGSGNGKDGGEMTEEKKREGVMLSDEPAVGQEEVAVGAPTPLAGAAGGQHIAREYAFRQEEEDLHVIDASASVEEVAEEVWKVVSARVEAVERGEVGKVVRRVL